MESTEEVQWKLSRCPSCQHYRMMPEANTMCLQCEIESRVTILSAEDIRWIISYREPESFVRAAWMLASENTSAMTGLDLRTGRVTTHRWAAGEKMTPEDDVLILAVCPASRRAELSEFLAAVTDGMLSEEDAEELACEVVVRAALGDGGKRFWGSVNEQLRAHAARG